MNPISCCFYFCSVGIVDHFIVNDIINELIS
jgi:hypothetical protein